ncbi:related to BYE1 - negative regulator of transcription elongation [Ustilago trichophora]|uniref:Transcription factor BYE1 n=1 Tax=Ustilago trichophora TaxID=86804 RepID=A0A5C3DPR4_9BASI|nr:related to BYE1 - negative regulator of transcription elongation [Ustilago trichophora]
MPSASASASASEVMAASSGSHDVEADATSSGPRRGARTRKPTSKAAGLEPAEIAPQAPPRAGRKRKADDLSADQQTKVISEQEADADRIDEEVDEVFDAGEGGDTDDHEDEKQYCICRGKDDGTFMISCERCQEWYHTKCIGITQKAAKKLEEYVCESCSTKDVETRTTLASKPTKRYKSSKGRKATQEAHPQADESASEREEEGGDNDNDDEDEDVSDGDEYVGERGDDASEAEDAMMEDAPVPAPLPRSQRRSDAEISFKARSASKSRVVSSTTAEVDKDDRRRASESLRRPSASSKSASAPKKGAQRKPAGPTDASTEEARSRARKVLATALEKIFSSNNAKQPQAKDDVAEEEAKEEEEEETDQQRAEAYSALLEEELFETNADTHGSIRVVGTKYKDRFRTFLFSLKDAKNTTLHSRIASGELKASELAKMSSDELANDTIRQATEKARLEALHRSTLRAEEAGPMRKITHKGEIEIESDTPEARDQPGKFQKVDKAPATRVSESEPAASKSARDEEDAMDTDQKLPYDDVARRSAPAPSTVQDSPSRLNFGDVWTQNPEASSQDDINDNDEPQESFGFDIGSPHDEAYDPNAATDADNAAVTSGADDFIDSFLDGPTEEETEPTASADPSASNQQTERSITPDSEPPSKAVHRYRNIIWNGLIDLPDVFAFQGHIKQVAGRSLAAASRVWPKFFPERPLLVAGRLPSKTAIEYLLQVVNAPRTEILAFTMEPGASKDGVARPQDSDQASFDGMLRHFKNADRWGALHVSSSVKGSLIKDFYVVPLYKDEEVPLWLDMAESDCLGADWHAKRDRDLLILVAVVIRDALQAELSKAERSEARQRSSTNDEERQRQSSNAQAVSESGQEERYDPTAGVSIPLGNTGAGFPAAVAGGAPAVPAAIGSDALQSLLRTLGKTTAPPSSGGVPAAASGALSPLGAIPRGPLPPGPPPGPPPSFAGIPPPPANASPMAGSWSPVPPHGGGADNSTPPQQWHLQQGYQAQPPYGYPGAADLSSYGHGGSGWGQETPMHPPTNATPPQPQEMPEEEYPGQYNPDFLAQASAGAARGGAGYGGRGRGQGYGHGYGQGRGRGRGGWRGRGW